MNQVFLNLLVNASQAIEGEGSITIRTSADDAAVHLKFVDTGRGIPEENLSRVFDPGFTTKGGNGSGSVDLLPDHSGPRGRDFDRE